MKYAESRKLRLKVNGYTDYIEPRSVKQIPQCPVHAAKTVESAA